MQSELADKINLHYRLFVFDRKKNSYIKKESEGNGGEDVFSHVAYHVAGNAGDTVLSKCVRRTVAEKLDLKAWNLIQVDAPVTKDCINQINSGRKLFIGGGGLFLPDSNANSLSGWQWAISPELLDQINVPIYIFSVGYNFFRGQEVSELFRNNLLKLVEKSSFIGMRNWGSIYALRELLPESYVNKIEFQPCTTTLIRKLYKSEIPDKHVTNKIAVNLAFDRVERRFGNNKEVILNKIAGACKKIESMGYKIYYVMHCGVDKEFLPYLENAGVRYKLKDLSLSYPREVFEFYNDMDLVIGMRGHAQMIPFGLNCEIISLGTHDKMRWFLEDIDALDWYVDVCNDANQLDEIIVNKFIDIHLDNNEVTKKRLIAQQARLWDITMNNLNKLV